MKVHSLSVHEWNKPFKCDICDYSFSLKCNMNRHIVSVHNGKKLYKCNICDATFSENRNMKKHVSQIHEGKKLWTMDTKDKLMFWINSKVQVKDTNLEQST